MNPDSVWMNIFPGGLSSHKSMPIADRYFVELLNIYYAISRKQIL